MTTYNTGNPIGSKDPRDLYDNAENLDEAVNTRQAESWDDRFGVARKTWWGMEQDFQQFLLDSGYVNIGDYGPGIEITERNQIFWRDGELYRAGASLELPYTTTGDWGDEEGLFVAVGDAALRQQLNSESGSGLIGISHNQNYSSGTIGRRLTDIVNVKDAPFNAVGDGAYDDSDSIQMALDYAGENKKILFIPEGTYLISKTLIFSHAGMVVEGVEASTILDFQETDIAFAIIFDRVNRISMKGIEIHNVLNSGIHFLDSDLSKLSDMRIFRPSGNHVATGGDAGEGYIRDGVSMRLYRPSREGTMAVNVYASNTTHFENVTLEGFHKGLDFHDWCHNSIVDRMYAISCNYAIDNQQYSDQLRLVDSYAALCFCFARIRGVLGGIINSCYAERTNIPLIINREGELGSFLTIVGFYTVADEIEDRRWYEITSEGQYPDVSFVNCSWRLPVKISSQAQTIPVRFIGPRPEILEGNSKNAASALFSDTPISLATASWWDSPGGGLSVDSGSLSKVTEFTFLCPRFINRQTLRVTLETGGSEGNYPMSAQLQVFRRNPLLESSRTLITESSVSIDTNLRVQTIDIPIADIDQGPTSSMGEFYVAVINAASASGSLLLISCNASIVNI